jgi:hypothetical protein
MADCAIGDTSSACDQSIATLEIGDSMRHVRSALACPDEWIRIGGTIESKSGRDEWWRVNGNTLWFDNGVLHMKSS